MNSSSVGLFLALLASVVVVVVTACVSDGECNGGQCYDAVGFLVGQRTCGCSENQRNDSTIHHRCLNDTGPTAFVTFTRNLSYEVGTYPVNWTCHNETQFCWSLTNRATVVSRDGAVYAALASSAPYLSLQHVRWRCRDRVYRRATALVGLLPIDSYCVQCDIACGIHGSCSLSDPTFTCQCYPGYTGARCTELANGASPIPPLWDNYTLLLAAEVYNGSRPCSALTAVCDTGERCYRTPLGQGRCYCDVGRLPTTGCALSAVLNASHVQWDVTQRVNVTYDSSDPRVQWALHDPSGVVMAVYSDLNVSSAFTTYTVDTRNQLYVSCDQLFWTGDPFTSCQGCATVCGPYANCSSSNPYNGTCVCLPGWTGERCTEQTTVNSSCAATRCTAHGICVNRQTECLCDPPYAGASANCSALAATCRVNQCSDHGTCTNAGQACLCDNGYYGPTCQWNATQCSYARCTNPSVGSCTTAQQGCTCSAYHSGVDCSLHQCIRSNASATYYLSMAVLNTTSCVCDTGIRNGSHCEQLICNGHGTFNATSDTCTCTNALYHQPDCRRTTCDPHGTVVDATTAYCNCSSPYTASVKTGLTTCVLPCQNGGSYDSILDRCQCDDTRYYGQRCQIAYPYVARPYTSDNFFIVFFSTVGLGWLSLFALYAHVYQWFDMPDAVLSVKSNRQLIASEALRQQPVHDASVRKSLGFVIPLRTDYKSASGF